MILESNIIFDWHKFVSSAVLKITKCCTESPPWLVSVSMMLMIVIIFESLVLGKKKDEKTISAVS